MKVLIIGYGSIGKRHFEVLSEFSNISSISVVTKQTLDSIHTYQRLESVKDITTYDYIVIASETNKHYQQLVYLERVVSDKIIFCEKPLFDQERELEIVKNRVFIGYVLRFHPLLQKLKEYLQTETCINVNIQCGQYLPIWRPNSDYRLSYSAKKSEGGGVLLDLSHEIDYLQWLFGMIEDIKSYQVKISDLEIDSDDLTMFIGRTKKGCMVNVSIDYISKITHRRLRVDTLSNSFEVDFIKNELIRRDKSGIEEVTSLSNLDRNFLFAQMHMSILKNTQTIACAYLEAQSVMKTINMIQEQN